jgi:hypothetical protein
VEIKFHEFLTSELIASERSTSRAAVLTARKEAPCPLRKRMDGERTDEKSMEGKRKILALGGNQTLGRPADRLS